MIKVYRELFPIPLLSVENFINSHEISLAKNFILNNLQKADNIDSVYNGLSTFSLNHDSSLLKELEINFAEWLEVNRRLVQVLTEFGYYSSIKFEQLQNSWFNVQKKDSLLKNHVHIPGSNISGAIYLDVGPGSSPITFYNDFNNKKGIVYLDYSNKFASEHFKIWPEVGDLVIFPSFISHGSDEINYYNNRMVISFNAV